MEDKNKLFVFEKKEVVLIFLFIALISIISFTLGVRTGKQLSLKHDDYTREDVQNINLKSVAEEDVEKVVEEPIGGDSTIDPTIDPTMDAKTEPSQEGADSMESRLREEMEKLATEDVKVQKPTETMGVKKVEEPTKEDVSPAQGAYAGKYTIQIFSHQSQEAAQDFADGFIVKGYDVIINEVVIPGKGKWYRVGVGIFDNVNAAKEYLEKEKALFQDKKYIIQQI